MKRHVTMRQAYAWTCEDCGRDNFAEAISLDPESDAVKELREQHGIMPYESGQWVHCPDSVTCQHCDAEFSAVDERSADDGDEELA